MEQRQLWHDTAQEAYEADIMAIGGPKKAAKLLWPTMDSVEAGKKIRRCIDPEHDQKFSEKERDLLIEAAARVGSRCLINYYGQIANFKIVLIAREDAKENIVERYEKVRQELQALNNEMRFLDELPN